MWNRKNEETRPPQRQNSPEPVRHVSPQATAPPVQQHHAPAAQAGPQGNPPQQPQPAREQPRPTAGIGASVTIVGEIFSAEDLYIDGEVDGVVDSQSRVTIGNNGKVKAHVRAREVVVQGSVQGNVEASEKITIRKTGSLVGDIKTGGIVVDDGAYFKGSIDIVKAPPIVNKAEERETEAVAR